MPFDAQAFLTSFGYLDPLEAHSAEAVQTAIGVAQAAYGIPVTHAIDQLTENVFSREPRCGMPDTVWHTIGMPHWGLKRIAWCLTAHPLGSGLTKQQVDTTIGLAFSQWSEHCSLEFFQVQDQQQANIIMGVGRGRRADFDGASGVLAWMQLPSQENYRGQLSGLFDGDENWAIEGRGILLLNVACHEIGHALGLVHSRRSDQLMSPTYSSRVPKPLNEDVERIQKLYGPRTAAPVPPVVPPVVPPPAGGPVECEVRIGGPTGQVFAGTLNRKP